jgi:hypothetical protein
LDSQNICPLPEQCPGKACGILADAINVGNPDSAKNENFFVIAHALVRQFRRVCVPASRQRDLAYATINTIVVEAINREALLDAGASACAALTLSSAGDRSESPKTAGKRRFFPRSRKRPTPDTNVRGLVVKDR